MNRTYPASAPAPVLRPTTLRTASVDDGPATGSAVASTLTGRTAVSATKAMGAATTAARPITAAAREARRRTATTASTARASTVYRSHGSQSGVRSRRTYASTAVPATAAG